VRRKKVLATKGTKSTNEKTGIFFVCFVPFVADASLFAVFFARYLLSQSS
jgi:hypothetical protein